MTINQLEKRRAAILEELSRIGDMRSGTISVRYQRCSNSSCVCRSFNHPGHGPIYSLSMHVDGKTKIKNYRPGPELAKVEQEVENYRRYRALSQELVSVSNAICDLRRVSVVSDVDEWEALKKKLEKQFKKKLEKKSTRL
jgi:hypothetical protein